MKHARNFMNGFMKGVLAPVAVLASMYVVSRPAPEDPFKGIEFGSVHTDKKKIQGDFAKALKEEVNYAETQHQAVNR